VIHYVLKNKDQDKIVVNVSLNSEFLIEAINEYNKQVISQKRASNLKIKIDAKNHFEVYLDNLLVDECSLDYGDTYNIE